MPSPRKKIVHPQGRLAAPANPREEPNQLPPILMPYRRRSYKRGVGSCTLSVMTPTQFNARRGLQSRDRRAARLLKPTKRERHSGMRREDRRQPV